jgi:hypothetical protein
LRVIIAGERDVGCAVQALAFEGENSSRLLLFILATLQSFPEGPKLSRIIHFCLLWEDEKHHYEFRSEFPPLFVFAFCPSVCQKVLIFLKHSPGDLVGICQVCLRNFVGLVLSVLRTHTAMIPQSSNALKLKIFTFKVAFQFHPIFRQTICVMFLE